jgi:hypothetical protein
MLTSPLFIEREGNRLFEDVIVWESCYEKKTEDDSAWWLLMMRMGRLV